MYIIMNTRKNQKNKPSVKSKKSKMRIKGGKGRKEMEGGDLFEHWNSITTAIGIKFDELKEGIVEFYKNAPWLNWLDIFFNTIIIHWEGWMKDIIVNLWDTITKIFTDIFTNSESVWRYLLIVLAGFGIIDWVGSSGFLSTAAQTTVFQPLNTNFLSIGGLFNTIGAILIQLWNILGFVTLGITNIICTNGLFIASFWLIMTITVFIPFIGFIHEYVNKIYPDYETIYNKAKLKTQEAAKKVNDIQKNIDNLKEGKNKKEREKEKDTRTELEKELKTATKDYESTKKDEQKAYSNLINSNFMEKLEERKKVAQQKVEHEQEIYDKNHLYISEDERKLLKKNVENAEKALVKIQDEIIKIDNKIDGVVTSDTWKDTDHKTKEQLKVVQEKEEKHWKLLMGNQRILKNKEDELKELQIQFEKKNNKHQMITNKMKQVMEGNDAEEKEKTKKEAETTFNEAFELSQKIKKKEDEITLIKENKSDSGAKSKSWLPSWFHWKGGKNKTKKNQVDEEVNVESVIHRILNKRSIASLNKMPKTTIDELKENNSFSFEMAKLCGFIKETDSGYLFDEKKINSLKEPIISSLSILNEKCSGADCHKENIKRKGGKKRSTLKELPITSREIKSLEESLTAIKLIHTASIHALTREAVENEQKEIQGGQASGSRRPRKSKIDVPKTMTHLKSADIEWLQEKFPEDFKIAKKLKIVETKEGKTKFTNITNEVLKDSADMAQSTLYKKKIHIQLAQ